MAGDCLGGGGGGGSGRKLRHRSAGSNQFEMDEEPKHPNKGLSFVRVLNRGYSKELQIPQEFASSFNGSLPHRFIIEDIVTKKCWSVHMEEDVDGQMYLREGWPDFVESHSLEVGNFLIFKYEERSIFHLKIYGRNGCEKTSSHHKLGKNTESEKFAESESFKCDVKIIGKHHQRKRIREPSPKKNTRGIYKKKHVVVKHYSRTVKTSISKTSVGFSITLHKWKNHQFSQLTIPKIVSLQKLWNKEKVMLQNAKGNCWPVKVVCRRDGRRLFSQGWKDFLKENEFARGDTLNFEFISDGLIQVCATKTLQVSHRSEKANNQTEASYMDNKHGIYEKPGEEAKKKMRTVKVSISEDRVCFSSSLQKHHQFTQLTIPKAVTLQKLHEKERMMLRDEKGNGWPVKVAHRRSGQAIFSQGWKEFMKENGFAPGDTLNFEFVSDNLIQVCATKASLVDHHSEESKYENQAGDMDCAVCEDDKPATTSMNDEAIEDSITTKKVSYGLRNSTFSVTWTKNTTGTYLDIPKAVAEDQNLNNKETIVFCDPEGKCWPLQVRTWWDGRAVLTKGWVDFWKGHAITEGDSLHFEFVSEYLIKVTVKRGDPTLEPAMEVVDDDHPEAVDSEEAALPAANAAAK